MTKGELIKLIKDVPDDATVAVDGHGKVHSFLARDEIFSLKRGEEKTATHIILMGEIQ